MAYGLKGIELVLLNAHGEGDSVDAVWENKIANLRELQSLVKALYTATHPEGMAADIAAHVVDVKRREAECFPAFDDSTGLIASVDLFDSPDTAASERREKRIYFKDYQQKVGHVISALNNINHARQNLKREPRTLDGGVHHDICQLSGWILEDPIKYGSLPAEGEIDERAPKFYYSQSLFDDWKIVSGRHLRDALGDDAVHGVVLDPMTSVVTKTTRWGRDVTHGNVVQNYKKALLIQRLADACVMKGEYELLKLLMAEEVPAGIEKKWTSLQAIMDPAREEEQRDTFGMMHVDAPHRRGGEGSPFVRMLRETTVNERIRSALTKLLTDYDLLASEGFACLVSSSNDGEQRPVVAGGVQRMLSESDLLALRGERVRLAKVIASGCPDASLDLRAHAAYRVSKAMGRMMESRKDEAAKLILVNRQLILLEMDKQIGGAGPAHAATERAEQALWEASHGLRKNSLLRLDSKVMAQHGQDAVQMTASEEAKLSPLHKLLLELYRLIEATNAKLVSKDARGYLERMTLIGRLMTSYQRSKRVGSAAHRAMGGADSFTEAGELNELLGFFDIWAKDTEIKRAVKSSGWCGRTLRQILTGLRDFMEGRKESCGAEDNASRSALQRIQHFFSSKKEGSDTEKHIMTGAESLAFLQRLPDVLSGLAPGERGGHMGQYAKEQEQHFHASSRELLASMRATMEAGIAEVVAGAIHDRQTFEDGEREVGAIRNGDHEEAPIQDDQEQVEEEAGGARAETAREHEARLALEARALAAEEARQAAEAEAQADRNAMQAMRARIRELEARDVQRGAAVVLAAESSAADEGGAARRGGLDDLAAGERRERPLNRGFLGRREDRGGVATAEVHPVAGEGDASPAAARANWPQSLV